MINFRRRCRVTDFLTSRYAAAGSRIWPAWHWITHARPRGLLTDATQKLIWQFLLKARPLPLLGSAVPLSIQRQGYGRPERGNRADEEGGNSERWRWRATVKDACSGACPVWDSPTGPRSPLKKLLYIILPSLIRHRSPSLSYREYLCGTGDN